MTLNLIHGEAIAEMAKLGNESVDHIIVDLPYGVTANKWDAVIPFDQMWEQFNRIIKPHGNIVLFAIQPFASQLIMSNAKNYKYELIWQKTNPTGHLTSKYRPLRKHENILIFQKDKTKTKQSYTPQKTEGHAPSVTEGHSKHNVTSDNYGNTPIFNRSIEDNIKGIRHPTTVIDDKAIKQVYNPQKETSDTKIAFPKTKINNGTTYGDVVNKIDVLHEHAEKGIRYPTTIVNDKSIKQVYNPQKTEGHGPYGADLNKLNNKPGSNYGEDWEAKPKDSFEHSEKGIRHPTTIVDDKSIKQVYNPQFKDKEGNPYEGEIIPRPSNAEREETRQRQYHTMIYNQSNFKQIKTDYLYPTTVVEFKNPRQKTKGAYLNHPTKKPIDLMQYLVRQYSNEGETILDCCMGGGSTGVACVRENRNFIGIELDEKYFNGASNWIDNESGGI